ncbi:hypothetical protein CC2G_007925 [Coprinopsis cinerea AmutBmut pab1-1]|nr:hypothetical protein CC2G_007925 [Coprinopsis cinerea AmutBmut pab1-1]
MTLHSPLIRAVAFLYYLHRRTTCSGFGLVYRTLRKNPLSRAKTLILVVGGGASAAAAGPSSSSMGRQMMGRPASPMASFLKFRWIDICFRLSSSIRLPKVRSCGRKTRSLQIRS